MVKKRLIYDMGKYLVQFDLYNIYFIVSMLNDDFYN